jgi:hypothetical protein
MSNGMTDYERGHKWFALMRHIIGSRLYTFKEEEFAPYTNAIGRLLLAWNDLHEKLSLILVIATDTDWPSQVLSFWHSIRNDVGKRALIATAISNMSPSIDSDRRDRLFKEVTWVLDTAKGLEDLRDDAAHTPLDYIMPPAPDHPFRKLMASGIKTNSLSGNKRAEKLKREDLIKRFEYARQRIVILRDYVIGMDAAWHEHSTWPDRPSLPHPPPTGAGKSQAPQPISKQQPHPPQSSGE